MEATFSRAAKKTLSNSGQAAHDEIANWVIASHGEAINGRGVDS